MKKYFVWKDRSCNGVNPVWLELNGHEFYAFVSAEENRGRYYVTLDNGGCKDADILIMEATKAAYQEWHAEDKAATRHYKRDEPYVNKTVSFDEQISGRDDTTYHDTVAADQPDVADIAIHTCDLAWLQAALASLTDAEMELINSLYLANQEGRSERAVARELGIAHMTLVNRHKRILKKLENF